MISVFDMLSIGVGPSSSHTVGPMRASRMFVKGLLQKDVLSQVSALVVELYGSLALTGKGHGTDYAVLMGLEGQKPETIDPVSSKKRFESIYEALTLHLDGQHRIAFAPESHLMWHVDKLLPLHANGMCLSAYDAQNNILSTQIYYSVGGGFVVDAAHFDSKPEAVSQAVPYPFETAQALFDHARAQGLTLADVIRANERARRDDEAIDAGLMRIWDVMQASIDAGCHHTEDLLPGVLKVRRRAPLLYRKLQQGVEAEGAHQQDPFHALSVYAIAVNEQNAAGGRVVTAPTNGAAGIIPAVFQFHLDTYPGAQPEDFIPFILTATAIGILYKKGASISAAEVGCQGEVGVACSMASAGLAALWGGNLDQIENAAEIGMEHHLGLTCDPIAGLVQIPCIERNAMGAVQAVGAAKLALMENGEHHVSLDTVIATMRQTGHDMSSKYKETSQGGLAVNMPAC